MNSVLLLGFIAASLTTFAFLPQSIKAIRSKHTKDLSLPMLLMMEAGVILWIIYGAYRQDLPLFAANIISFCLITVVLILKIKHG